MAVIGYIRVSSNKQTCEHQHYEIQQFVEHKADAEEPIFMKEWEQELDKFLVFNQKQILNNAGTVSRMNALRHASCEYAKYKLRIRQEEKANSVKEYKEDIKEL